LPIDQNTYRIQPVTSFSARAPSSRRFSVVGTFVVVFALVAGLIWVGVSLVGRSFVPEGTERDAIAGLGAAATITRDQQGIPYVVAASEADAYAAIGYAHAQDRLWQMDMMRRAGEGRLSEVFGRRTIGYDALLRTVGFERISAEILRSMAKPTRSALEAYARGVNAFIESHRGRLPMEFDALDYEPEPWSPIHSVMVSRLLAWELNTSFWTDVVYGAIRGRVDSLRFQEILPSYPTDAPTIIPGGQRPEPAFEAPAPRVRDTVATPVAADSARESAALPLDVLRLERSMREFLGMSGAHLGSNAWAVAPSRAAGGRAMLANDPHLMHTAPSRWYQVVMIVGDDHRAGVTIPGAPFIVSGRNDRISWGITALMADEADFYVERLDSATGTRALHDGAWEKLREIRDTIVVKDSASVPFIIRISRHGPLISDVHPFSSTYPQRDTSGIPLDTASPLARATLALRWRGSDVSQELVAFHRINRARTLDEFTSAVRLGGVPSLNFVYADARGRIAAVPSARVPVRGAGDPNLPMPGWESRYNWKGAVPSEKLPRLVDPDRAWVASANNKVANGLAFTFGDQWEDPSRAFRLEQLLQEGARFEVVDFVQMQGDVLSPQMRMMVEHLLRAFPDSARQPSAVRDAIARLRGWDGTMAADGVESAIAAAWFQRLVERTYRDELGPVVFAHYVFIAQSPIKALRRHARTDSRWFDDVSTPAVRETRDMVMRAALGDALRWLSGRFSSSTATAWRYGAFHTLSMPHPFGRQERLGSIVNVGPIELGGSNTTLNNAEWDFNRPYNVRVGPSMRQIVDFADTAVFLRSIVTTGSSGQPLSRFYSNQTLLWSANGHISMLRTVPVGPAVSSLTELEPRGE
jgi:penicillin amidase